MGAEVRGMWPGAKGKPLASRIWKMERMDSPLQPLEGSTPADTLILAPLDTFQMCDLQN